MLPKSWSRKWVSLLSLAHSPMAVLSIWLALLGIRRLILRLSSAQLFSMGLKSGERAGHCTTLPGSLARRKDIARALVWNSGAMTCGYPFDGAVPPNA